MTSLKNRSTFQTSEELQKRGEAIRLQMSQGVSKPSEKMNDISSGDIHTAGMKPITFVRQVLAGCLYPDLLSSDTLPHDARIRAQKLLEHCHGGSVGAYAESCGMDRVRRTVANFITARDGGLPSKPDNICIASGSLRALTVILKLLAQGNATLQTGVMIPVPYPHTLHPILDRVGSVPLPYILREQTGWRIEKAELDRALQASKSHCWPRAIYISNPGNPTGHVQSRESIQEVIKFAAEQNLFVLADEVYQDTVFGEETEFVSYKKVLAEMGPPYSHTVQMASVNSLSNGIMGECGFRTGYMELVNVDESMMLYVETLLCGDISTLVIGQLALDIMADPPHPGDPSYDLYKQEVESRHHTLKSNMRRAAEIFNTLPGFHCIPPQSGIFICPHLRFSHTALGHAQELGVEAGRWYCERLLEEEGLCVAMYECTCDHQSLDCVSGSNWHLRLCVLMPFETLEQVLSQLQAFHHRFLKAH